MTHAHEHLIKQAHAMVARSTSPQAEEFDVERWLAVWLQTPQPALGGQMPTELLGSPEGLETVSRLLGAIESGSFQ